jgi:DNA-binding NtrC family response regulator
MCGHASKRALMEKKEKTILVVDDDIENARSYCEILTDLDYRVITCGEVSAALALLQTDKAVDLIITDYRMPGKSGLDFIVALRQIQPDVPVIMITAYGNIETYLRSMSLGAFEFVNKPVRKEEFERIVRHALSHEDAESRKGKDDDEQYSYH